MGPTSARKQEVIGRQIDLHSSLKDHLHRVTNIYGVSKQDFWTDTNLKRAF